jgi:hypothetical protein
VGETLRRGLRLTDQRGEVISGMISRCSGEETTTGPGRLESALSNTGTRLIKHNGIVWFEMFWDLFDLVGDIWIYPLGTKFRKGKNS